MKKFAILSILRITAICFALCIFTPAGAQVHSAQNDLFNVLESSCSNYLDVEANDAFNGVPLLQITSQPANGTGNLNGSYITYCPTPGFTGSDRFQYSITGGGNTDSAWVYINVQTFNSYVFPGDADQNGKVENFDVLAIGLTYNATGPSRRESLALNALAWPPSPYINSNPGAADCDGNGIVDTLDISPVASFYNDTAPFGNRYDVDTSLCNNGMPFYIESINSDTVLNGDTLRVKINLGSDSTNQAYGIAFTLDYDTSFIPRNSIRFSADSSWLLQNDRGIFFNRESDIAGKIDLALTKTNQTVARGGGHILDAIIPIDDNICGIIHAQGWYPLFLQLNKIRLINSYNELENICTMQSAITIYKDPTAVSRVEASDISVYPNPTNDRLIIRADNIKQVIITDITGRNIFSQTYDNPVVATMNLKAWGIETGVYLVYVKTASSSGVVKIIIQQ